MLELANQSTWSAGVYPGWGKDRGYQYTLVVKQSFNFDLSGLLTPISEPEEIQAIDEHYDDPMKTSLKAVNEIAPFKRGGEIIVYGTAYPHKAGTKASQVSVELVGEGIKWKKKLVVFGKRQWKKGFMGAQISEQLLREPVPLIYENAYGGEHPDNEDDYVAANPVGFGYIAKGQNPDGIELPNIESLKQLIKNPKDKPSPAGFGPIPVFWAPRDELGEDIDEEAARIGECHYGKKVPENLYNCAPADQQFKSAFTGGEYIILEGFFESVTTPVKIKLDLEVPDVVLLETDEEQYLDPVMDTIVVNADEQRVHCIWRQPIPHDRNETEISWLYVRDEATNQMLMQKEQTA